ncbi:hypothetical protein [Mycoplasma seminis]|uniref:Chromosome partition protein Smc n=1 Tax=Mycoplasma seminis TaxID=512749 RepID=A0ABY9HBP4_9MOLU|nr:hypothetical protein [Mycoplasma seminis]WLP85901.1 hypothetical protein Q8852_02025 [Mycoplasma seminis]
MKRKFKAILPLTIIASSLPLITVSCNEKTDNKEQITNLQKQISDLNVQIQNHQNTINNYQNENNTLQTKVTEKENKIKELITQINTLNQTKTEHEAKISELTNQKSQVEENKKQLESQITQLNKDKQVLEARIKELEEQNKNITPDNKDLKNEIDTLKQSIKEKETQIQKLTSSNEKLEQSKQQLQNQLISLTNEKTNLEAKIKDLEAKAEKSKKDKEELNNQISQLNNTIKTNQELINSLRQQLQSAQNEIERLKNNNSGLETKTHSKEYKLIKKIIDFINSDNETELNLDLDVTLKNVNKKSISYFDFKNNGNSIHQADLWRDFWIYENLKNTINDSTVEGQEINQITGLIKTISENLPILYFVCLYFNFNIEFEKTSNMGPFWEPYKKPNNASDEINLDYFLRSREFDEIVGSLHGLFEIRDYLPWILKGEENKINYDYKLNVDLNNINVNELKEQFKNSADTNDQISKDANKYFGNIEKAQWAENISAVIQKLNVIIDENKNLNTQNIISKVSECFDSEMQKYSTDSFKIPSFKNIFDKVIDKSDKSDKSFIEFGREWADYSSLKDNSYVVNKNIYSKIMNNEENKKQFIDSLVEYLKHSTEEPPFIHLYNKEKGVFRYWKINFSTLFQALKHWFDTWRRYNMPYIDFYDIDNFNSLYNKLFTSFSNYYSEPENQTRVSDGTIIYFNFNEFKISNSDSFNDEIKKIFDTELNKAIAKHISNSLDEIPDIIGQYSDVNTSTWYINTTISKDNVSPDEYEKLLKQQQIEELLEIVNSLKSHILGTYNFDFSQTETLNGKIKIKLTKNESSKAAFKAILEKIPPHYLPKYDELIIDDEAVGSSKISISGTTIEFLASILKLMSNEKLGKTITIAENE